MYNTIIKGHCPRKKTKVIFPFEWGDLAKINILVCNIYSKGFGETGAPTIISSEAVHKPSVPHSAS